MRFKLSKCPPSCLGLTVMLAMTTVTTGTGVAVAQDADYDVLEWVALADDDAAPDEPRGETKRDIIHEEVEEIIEGGRRGQRDVFFFRNPIGGGEEPGKFWIGVECREASPELRAQLGLEEGHGLVVVRVSDASAAEKAGLKRHDVIVAAGDAKLAAVPELAKAVNAADGKPIAIKIIRAGKEQTVEVTPSERPGDVVKFIARPHAGMFIAAGANLGRLELPENMTIKIERHGKEPAKIEVKRDDDTWEITEKHLEKLPADVRPLVERALGGGSWTMPLPPMPGAPMGGGHGIATPPMMQIEALPEGGVPGRRMRIKAFVRDEEHLEGPRDHSEATPVPPPRERPRDVSPEIMERLDQLDRRLEQMQDEIRRLRNERPGSARFERGGEPRDRRIDRRDDRPRDVEIEIDDRPVPRPSR